MFPTNSKKLESMTHLDRSLPVSGIQMSMYENIRRLSKTQSSNCWSPFKSLSRCLAALLRRECFVHEEPSALAGEGVAQVQAGRKSTRHSLSLSASLPPSLLLSRHSRRSLASHDLHGCRSFTRLGRASDVLASPVPTC